MTVEPVDAGVGLGLGVVPAAVVEPVDPRRQGRYAGIVSRTVAISTDAVVLSVLSIGSLLVIQAVVAMVRSEPFGNVTIDPDWAILLVLGQSAAYFTVGWAVFGRTAGEALFGLRTVRRNGEPVGWIRAFVRFLVSPLSFSLCGLGFFWILVDRRRRTWSDLAAGTVVVYDWRRADQEPVEVIQPHA
jgi:uncharacterized RDD family membrane protein YckC